MCKIIIIPWINYVKRVNAGSCKTARGSYQSTGLHLEKTKKQTNILWVLLLGPGWPNKAFVSALMFCASWGFLRFLKDGAY